MCHLLHVTIFLIWVMFSFQLFLFNLCSPFLLLGICLNYFLLCLYIYIHITMSCLYYHLIVLISFCLFLFFSVNTPLLSLCMDNIRQLSMFRQCSQIIALIQTISVCLFVFLHWCFYFPLSKCFYNLLFSFTVIDFFLHLFPFFSFFFHFEHKFGFWFHMMYVLYVFSYHFPVQHNIPTKTNGKFSHTSH